MTSKKSADLGRESTLTATSKLYLNHTAFRAFFQAISDFFNVERIRYIVILLHLQLIIILLLRLLEVTHG